MPTSPDFVARSIDHSAAVTNGAWARLPFLFSAVLATVMGFGLLPTNGRTQPTLPEAPISSALAVGPTAALTAPTANAVFTSPRTLTLTAAAVATSGSITKVEFFNGSTKLGEDLSPPYEYTWSVLAPGVASLMARATDNTGLAVNSAPVAIRLLPSLPFTADFETTEGYSSGTLNGQRGWTVASGTASVISGGAALGTQSVTLSAQATVTELDLEFGSAPPNPTLVYADLFAKPVAGADYTTATLLDVDAARVAFIKSGAATGQFAALAGDGLGAGAWRNLGPTVAVNTTGAAQTWQRVTARLNYTTKTWDLYLNSVMIAADLKFRLNSASYFSWLSLKGHAAAPVQLDDVYIAPLNPLFTDFNKNGIIDTWEAAHGMWLGSDNRQADADNDGLNNVQEYVAGTNPIKADTDGDGLPDGWETRYGLDPVNSSDASADMDGDGISNLSEYKQGRNPSKGAIQDATQAVRLNVYLPR